jgi:hypothetical protein
VVVRFVQMALVLEVRLEGDHPLQFALFVVTGEVALLVVHGQTGVVSVEHFGVDRPAERAVLVVRLEVLVEAVFVVEVRFAELG